MPGPRRICPECGAHQRDPTRTVCDVCEARLGPAEGMGFDDLLASVDRALRARGPLAELESQRRALRTHLVAGEGTLSPSDRERARDALERVERVLAETR